MKKNLLTIVAFATAFVACNKTEAPVAEVGAPVQFRASVANEYVMKSTIIDNPIDDSYGSTQYVGIFAGTPISVDNMKYAITGATTLAPVDDANTIAWKAGQSATTTFKAYFPYNSSATATNIPITVLTAQNTGAGDYSGINSSDFLYAIDENCAANTASALTFNHRLSKVVINITNHLAVDVTNVAIGKADDAGNLKTTATYNISTDALSSLGSAAIINAKDNGTVDSKRQFVAIVIPQSAQPKIVVTVEGGTTYTFSLNSSFEFVAGQAATAALSLEPDAAEGIAASYTYTVGAWGAGSAMEISDVVDKGSVNNKWSIIGNIMGSSWNQDFYMTASATPAAYDSDVTWTGHITSYTAGQEFKLRWNNDWGSAESGTLGYNAGAPTASSEYFTVGSEQSASGGDYGNKNFKLAENGNYTIVFNSHTYKITITKD